MSSSDDAIFCNCVMPPFFNGEWHMSLECSHHRDMLNLLNISPTCEQFLQYFPNGYYLYAESVAARERFNSAPIYRSTPAIVFNQEPVTPINHLSPVVRRTPTPYPMTPINEEVLMRSADDAELDAHLDVIDAALARALSLAPIAATPRIKRVQHHSSPSSSFSPKLKKLKF